jgi:Tfp pilus assembly protein PilX
MDWTFGLQTVLRRAIAIGVLVVVLALIVLTLSYCSERRRAAEADAGRTMADARSGAATDSHKIRDANEDANAATRAEVKEATDELRQADPADRDRVFRDRVCRLNPGACPR